MVYSTWSSELDVTCCCRDHPLRKLDEAAPLYLNDKGGNRVVERKFSRTQVSAMPSSTEVGATAEYASDGTNAAAMLIARTRRKSANLGRYILLDRREYMKPRNSENTFPAQHAPRRLIVI